ncbi:alpha/beta fold hydrolase [Oryzifoliimicrobium ureilyticus]|uniref:alpha/beta fold hydrolase n=1 Tax=Oryzifoliimicrobium ureilyticus TaxID=3113724 RepID=UPI00307635B9
MTDTHSSALTRFIAVDGENIAYRRFGNAANGQPPLILIQHFRGGMDHWDPVMTDGLAAGREVILYNGRGIASSSGAPRNRIEDMADDIAAFIVALGLGQADLLGFSIGGMQAQDVVLRHPDLIRRLLLLGTGPRGGTFGSDERVIPIATRPEPLVDDFLFLFFGRSEAAVQAGHDFWERRHQRVDQDRPTSLLAMQAQMEANIAWLTPVDPNAPLEHLRAIKQPTFILNGIDDVMIPTVNAFNMAQVIPDAQLVLYPDSGHGAQFQYPERFLGHAIQFLNEA